MGIWLLICTDITGLFSHFVHSCFLLYDIVSIHWIRYSRFQGVASLTLHFPENFGAETTQIRYIGLKGEATQVISLPKIGCHGRVVASTDDFLLIWINSWSGMLLQQSCMKLLQILLITSKSLFAFMGWFWMFSWSSTIVDLCLNIH